MTAPFIYVVPVALASKKDDDIANSVRESALSLVTGNSRLYPSLFCIDRAVDKHETLSSFTMTFATEKVFRS